jgi:hypothetical protein
MISAVRACSTRREHPPLPTSSKCEFNVDCTSQCTEDDEIKVLIVPRYRALLLPLVGIAALIE